METVRKTIDEIIGALKLLNFIGKNEGSSEFSIILQASEAKLNFVISRLARLESNEVVIDILKEELMILHLKKEIRAFSVKEDQDCLIKIEIFYCDNRHASLNLNGSYARGFMKTGR